MRRYLAALVFALLLPLPALAAQVTVQPGETLSEIADRHGVSLSKLMQLNGISKADHIEVGQVLRLPANARGVSVGKGGGGGGATGTVRVQEGDTLSDIAVRQGMELDRLMALNGISKADHIEVGQVLKVTGKPAPPAPTYRRGASVHVVQPGESLSEIAEGYGVAMSRLVAINQLDDPDHVESGRRLKLTGPIPSPRPTTASAPAQPVAAAPKPVARRAAPVSRATAAAAEAPESVAPLAAAVAAVAPAAERPAATAPLQASPVTAATTLASAVPARSAFPVAATSTTYATAPVAASRAAATAVVPRAATTASTVATRTAIPAAAAVATPVASRSVAAAVAPAAAASAATPKLDWRRYGPLQVDWSGWQPMGGSLVAPVMNAKGDTLYLAINCGARKLNATSAAGDWRTWDNPQADFEQRLVNDLCRSRGS